MLNHMVEDKDTHLMRQALIEAKKAYSEGEIPIGAVVAIGDRIIGRGHNQTERLNDPTAHAEIIALTSAFNFLGSKYLPDATLYVTVEPCLMCAGALYWSKVGRVVYGAPDEKNGYLRICGPRSPFHPKTVLETGLLAEECADLIKSFFQGKR
jgi:tRNA(adenine34) deaminase